AKPVPTITISLLCVPFRLFSAVIYYRSRFMPEYVNWLRHASPYINAHRDCTFIVMLPGDGVEHPNFGNIVHDLVLLHSLGVRLVLVHGSRPQIETRLAARGLTPHYHHGM
ncbi:Amino-acid acetyltransferase, partial [Pseudomonas savastanoi pv. glycinea]